MAEPVRVVEQVRRWRDELIDLSRRNRLLNFKPGGRGASLRILQPPVIEVLTRLQTGDGWRFHYPPPDTSETTDEVLLAALKAEDPELTDELQPDELMTDEASAGRISNKLRSLERRGSTEWVDRGLHVLYITIGALRYVDHDLELSAPLLLVPVNVARPNPREPFQVTATDDDIVRNPALAVKLETEFGIDLPDEVDPSEPLLFLKAVRDAVADIADWRVDDEVALSYFSFHKESMYQDLREHEEEICGHLLIQALSGAPISDETFAVSPIPEDQLDDKAAPEELVSFLDADSTQRQCIVAARDGHSFVMDGPPGSGKSQTIANMIAELMAVGKTILFVSEKAAALDVVMNRLEKGRLDHLVLALHSHKATRKELAKTLGDALSQHAEPDGSLTDAQISSARKHRAKLSEYAKAQNEIRQPLGHSLHWVFGRLEQLAAVGDVPIPELISDDLSAARLEELTEQASRLASAWGPVTRGTGFFWRDLCDPPGAQRRVSSIAHDIDAVIASLSRIRLEAGLIADELFFEPPTTETDLIIMATLSRLALERPPGVQVEWLTASDFDAIETRIAYLADESRCYEERSGRLQELAGSTCDALDISAVDRLESGIADAEQASPPLVLDADTTSESINGLLAYLRRLANESAQLDEIATELAVSLGVRPDDIAAAGASAVARAAQLVSSPHLPESTWLDQSGLALALNAVAVLQPVVTEYRSLDASLREVFNDSIAAFDVEVLYDGPYDLSPKLSRLSRRGRANRQILAATTEDGRVSRRVIDALPSLRQFKRVAAQFVAAEAEQAGALGSFYYRRTDTDFAALGAALETATEALGLIGLLADKTTLAGRLSRSAERDLHLAETGQWLEMAVSSWSRVLGEQLPSARALETQPFHDVTKWARDRAVSIELVVEALARVLDVVPSDDVGTLRNIAELRRANSELEAELRQSEQTDSALIGEAFAGVSTIWDEVLIALDWVSTTRTAARGARTVRQATALARIPGGAELSNALDEYHKDIDGLLDLFTLQYRNELNADLGEFLDDSEDLLRCLRDQVGEIDEWVTYCESRRRLVEDGLGDQVSYCEVNQVDAEAVPALVESGILTAYADATLASDSRCQPILPGQRDKLVNEFQNLDRLLVSHAAARVIEACNERRPSTAIGEVTIIQKEAAKKAKHRPIRTLLDDAGGAAQSLKPCFMMSPLSVSQFLPSSLRFDVVIFDEASQVRPCDAVNAIYRGKQLIVAGDDKQLPPTSFFDRVDGTSDDEYDAEELEVFGSVLDLCNGAVGVASLPLRWHYRSRHESLITYSNRAFYGSKLVTYPGAIDVAPDLGLELFHVPEAIYQRGGARDNPIEAQFVADRVLYHAETHPHLKVGVVAFSEAQANRILREIEAMRRERSDLDGYFADDRLDGFFVKNLESVQGDERDIIIFSVGYGRDEFGDLKMNFGPLNKEGGHRRLNVAITRARRRVEIVTSITSDDFKPTKSAGVGHLKRYLDFARRGLPALADSGDAEGGEPESPFEESVADAIRSLGYDAVPQVGQAGYRIDIGVKDPAKPGRYVLGVECDGAAYHSSRVARDRDRLRQEVLEGLGWRMHRIWGPAWYRSRSSEAKRLHKAIKRAIEDSETKPSISGEVHAPKIEFVESSFDGRPAWVIDYEPADIAIDISAAAMHEPAERSRLCEAITNVVKQEGPIAHDLCRQRVRMAWRVGRAGGRMRDAFNRAVDGLLADGTLLSLETGFLAMPGQDVRHVRGPVDGIELTNRKVTEVPTGELRLALHQLIVEARSITEDELRVSAARLFGWNRTGSGIAAALAAALDQLIDERLVERDERARIHAVGGRH